MALPGTTLMFVYRYKLVSRQQEDPKRKIRCGHWTLTTQTTAFLSTYFLTFKNSKAISLTKVGETIWVKSWFLEEKRHQKSICQACPWSMKHLNLCLFKICADVNALSHCVQLNGLSPVWLLSSLFKLLNCEHLYSHWEQQKGLSPECVISCLFKLLDVEYLYSHWEQPGTAQDMDI